MKCLICGRSALPGAKLCSDCRAARKRAFAATVTQPLLIAAARSKGEQKLLRPSQSVAATVRRAAEQSLFVKPPPVKKPTPRFRRTDFVWLAAALGVIVVSGVYAAHRFYVPWHPEAPSPVAIQSDAADRQAAATGMNVAPTPTALKPTAAEPNGGPAPDAAPSDIAKPDAARRSAGKRVVLAPSERMPLMQPMAAAPAVAPVLIVPVPTPPDPLQAMNEGFVRCAGGDLLDRMACDSRVRQQYCGGYWGRVPQCPIGPVTDHGQ
ncbi:MAG TPA: hypothetical protein VEN29_12735 [Casimicrobiaceae bacterium]|nr:hypothetical protein [Casimicrobiaceae bacterium]